jgi:hypothetical protein
MFYTRDEIVAVLTDYYQYLSRINLSSESIIYPPRGGWPSITAESMGSLNRTDEVIDLLKHLPYVSDKDGNEPSILPETNCVDYTSEPVQNAIQNNGGKWIVEPGESIPLDCVCLAHGRRHAYSVFLNLTHGTVIWYSNQGDQQNRDYDMGEVLDEDSPRHTLGEDFELLHEPTYDLKYFFGEFCKKKINEIHWLPCVDGEIREMHPELSPSMEHKAFQQYLRDSGFPGDGNGGGWDREKYRSLCYEYITRTA